MIPRSDRSAAARENPVTGQSSKPGRSEDDIRQPDEGAAAYEEDVRDVHRNEIVFIPVLRHVYGSENPLPLQKLEKALLHPLAADVAASGTRAQPASPGGDLVDFIDEDDPPLRLPHGAGLEQQLADDSLDVLAVVARLGVVRCVNDCYG